MAVRYIFFRLISTSRNRNFLYTRNSIYMVTAKNVMYDPKFKDKLLQLKFIEFRGPVMENSFKGHSLATNDRKMD